MGAHLDQLVRFQAAIDFRQHRIRQTVGADADHGMQGMGARLELAPFGGSEGFHGRGRFNRGRDSNPMKRSKTSKAWMHEHVTDPYVQRARAEGYRSRAAFKLLEIDAKDHLLRPGTLVVDLGAAPGSWAQVVVRKLGPAGHVVALDLLEFEPLPGVQFIQGDFREEAILAQLEAVLVGRPVDLVLSDMAPNWSGIAVSDQARAMHLAELTLEFAARQLKPGGDLLVKVFQGAGFQELRQAMQRVFGSVVVRKPQASRGRSAELYLLGRGRKG